MPKKQPPRAANGAPSPSRAKNKAQQRAETLAAVQQEQRQQRRRRTLLQATASAVAVAVVAAVVIYVVNRDGQRPAALSGVQSSSPERGHVDGLVDYPQTPPVGGPHNQAWLNCGIYDAPVPDVNAVHSMEHGAVWVTYRPDLASEDVQVMAAEFPDTYLVLSPYPDLPAPVVASAWGKQLRLTGADDERLSDFIREFRQGPQTPEPGAPCTGGVDASGELGGTVP